MQGEAWNMEVVAKTFLISGAGSGLGAATARLLASAGANVIIADLNPDAGESVAAELGERARFVKTDVTQAGDVQAAIQTALDQFGGLHGAISCAGIAIAAKLLGRQGPHDLEQFTKVVQINLIGTFNVIRLVANALTHNEPNAEGERGVIINTASIAAFDGQIGQVAYAASKGGVVALTLPLARELAREGIRVMTIAPGIFETPLMAGLPEAAQQALRQQIPFPARFGKPLEYAALAKHIIENPYLNGEVIRLDGTMRMPPK
jgi:NAD(P)-dependent dehydrogenase (short-subunit alcohol dehydrogenase family)